MNEFGTINTQMLGITEDQIREVDASEAEVVSRVLTPRIKDIVATIRPDGITFNTASVRSMNDVVFIQMYMDRGNHLLFVSPCEEYDKDSKQWCSIKNGLRTSKKISGRGFGDKIYKLMDWSKGYSFCVRGYPARQRGTENEYLLAFELDDFSRTLLTEKGLTMAGVDDTDLGEDAKQIHAQIAEEQEKKAKAKAEAKATGKKKRTKKKVEYSSEIEDGAFGRKKKEFKSRVEMPVLSELEQVGMDEVKTESPVVPEAAAPIMTTSEEVQPAAEQQNAGQHESQIPGFWDELR